MKSPTIFTCTVIGSITLLVAAANIAAFSDGHLRSSANNPRVQNTAAAIPVRTEETIAESGARRRSIEESCWQQLSDYVQGKFGNQSDVRMKWHDGRLPEESFFQTWPEDIIAIAIPAEQFGKFTETELSEFIKEIGRFYLSNNPYLDHCEVAIYPGMYVREWGRFAQVERHMGLEKEFNDSYKLLTELAQ